MQAWVSGWKRAGDEGGAAVGGEGARAVPEIVVLRAWQAADANLGGRVVELGIMQPASINTDAGNCALEGTRGRDAGIRMW